MADKRFWSGAIIVVAMVVAGAGSLPALLVRPAAPEVAPIIAVALLKAPEPVAPRPAEPVVQRASGPVSAPPEPVRSTTPVSTPAAASPGVVEPPQASQPVQVAAPPEAPREARPIAFPPVQPVGIAIASAPEAAAPQAPTQTRPTGATIEPAGKAARPSPVAAQGDRKRKRSVRPASYPIHEFLAWRR